MEADGEQNEFVQGWNQTGIRNNFSLVPPLPKENEFCKDI